MNAADLLVALRREANDRAYIRRLEILDRGSVLLKARLFVSPDLFVQIYRNDRFDTTNLSLIHNRQRIYGRDYLGGVWHRHSNRSAANRLLKFCSRIDNYIAR